MEEQMTVTVGINGFGRIGRCTLAHIAESGRNDVHVVKLNGQVRLKQMPIFYVMTVFTVALGAMWQ